MKDRIQLIEDIDFFVKSKFNSDIILVYTHYNPIMDWIVIVVHYLESEMNQTFTMALSNITDDNYNIVLKDLSCTIKREIEQNKRG